MNDNDKKQNWKPTTYTGFSSKQTQLIPDQEGVEK